MIGTPFKTDDEKSSMLKIGGYYGTMKINDQIVEVPLINAASATFRDSLQISISAFQVDTLTSRYTKHHIYYSFATAGDTTFHEYKTPFWIKELSTIKTYAEETNEIRSTKSKIATARFYKMPHPERTIKLLSKYSPQYAAGGDEALIDGIRGDTDWTKGNWQGYQGTDFESVINLGAKKNIAKCSAEFLQDMGAWIMMPRQAEFSFSDDGINFSEPCIIKNLIADTVQQVMIRNLSCSMEKPRTARYVKVKAVTYGRLPKWHESAGKDAWTFIDELFVE